MLNAYVAINDDANAIKYTEKRFVVKVKKHVKL